MFDKDTINTKKSKIQKLKFIQRDKIFINTIKLKT